jgi:hypothetical protein
MSALVFLERIDTDRIYIKLMSERSLSLYQFSHLSNIREKKLKNWLEQVTFNKAILGLKIQGNKTDIYYV